MRGSVRGAAGEAGMLDRVLETVLSPLLALLAVVNLPGDDLYRGLALA